MTSSNSAWDPNDGNTSRRFFNDPDVLAEITGAIKIEKRIYKLFTDSKFTVDVITLTTINLLTNHSMISERFNIVENVND